MGELNVFYLSNGQTVKTKVNYAAAGVSEDGTGEVINDQRFQDFWRRVRIALEKKYAEEENAKTNGD